MIEEALQPAINLGLDEEKFWNMTFAEINRWVNGATWRLKAKAQFDYTLAQLIGVSNSRIVSSDTKFPTLEESYPNLFEKTPEEVRLETEREKLIMSSQNNFMAFALQHNAKLKKQGVETKEK